MLGKEADFLREIDPSSGLRFHEEIFKRLIINQKQQFCENLIVLKLSGLPKKVVKNQLGPAYEPQLTGCHYNFFG
jgi:hypothetical protein